MRYPANRTGHTVATIHLVRLLPDGSSSQPGSLAAKRHCRVPSVRKATGARPLFGLAPGGVCRADAVASGPGALLPHPFTLACDLCRSIGGLLSVALSLASQTGDRRALPATLASWSPDFPLTSTRSSWACRRSGCLSPLMRAL